MGRKLLCLALSLALFLAPQLVRSGDPEDESDEPSAGVIAPTGPGCHLPLREKTPFCAPFLFRDDENSYPSPCGGEKFSEEADAYAAVRYSRFLELLRKSAPAEFQKEEHCQHAVKAAVCASVFLSCDQNGVSSCDIPQNMNSTSPKLFDGVCNEMCFEITVKCGLPPQACLNEFQFSTSESCTKFALDPAVGCRDPFSSSLDFCDRVQHPILAAPWDTKDTWLSADEQARTLVTKAAKKFKANKNCTAAFKEYFCSAMFPQCMVIDNTLLPMCRSTCHRAVECGIPAQVFNCSDNRLYSDDPDCSSYDKEPQPDHLAIALLVTIFMVLFLLVTATLVSYLLKKRSRLGYRKLNLRDDHHNTGMELMEDEM